MNNMPMYIGSICAFAFDFAPVGWVSCEGQRVNKNQAMNLFNVIGYQYGGSGDFFYLPDLRGKVILERGQVNPQSPNHQFGESGGVETVTLNTNTMAGHSHSVSYAFGANSTRTDVRTPVGNFPSKQEDGVLIYNARPSTGTFLANPTITLDPAGTAPTSMNVVRPYLVTNYCICIDGYFPVPDPASSWEMPALGTIQAFAASAIPGGWKECNGQTLPAQQYDELYTIIGTIYGGDDSNFGLPDLRGREVVGIGQGPGLSNYNIGQRGGNEQVTLLPANLPPHTHTSKGTMPSATAAETSSPDKQYPAETGDDAGAVYSPTSDGAMGGGNVTSSIAGGSQSINVMNPYQTLLYCILVGDPR